MEISFWKIAKAKNTRTRNFKFISQQSQFSILCGNDFDHSLVPENLIMEALLICNSFCPRNNESIDNFNNYLTSKWFSNN
jgi:hypothetical protein